MNKEEKIALINRAVANDRPLIHRSGVIENTRSKQNHSRAFQKQEFVKELRKEYA